VSQVIRARPFQIINRRDQPWFQPAALLHLRGLQSFAPLITTRLGQVFERTRVRFEPLESLEDRRPHHRCETAVHLGDILERAPLISAVQDRAEVPGTAGV
jgi:hypothetical protein